MPFPDADDTGMGRTLREAAGATHGVINLRGKPVRAALMEVSDNVVISGFFMSLFSGTAIELSCGCSLEKKALSRGLAAISVIISSAFQPFSHAYANKWWYLRKRSTLSWLSEKCPKAAHIRMLLQILHCNDFFLAQAGAVAFSVEFSPLPLSAVDVVVSPPLRLRAIL